MTNYYDNFNYTGFKTSWSGLNRASWVGKKQKLTKLNFKSLISGSGCEVHSRLRLESCHIDLNIGMTSSYTYLTRLEKSIVRITTDISLNYCIISSNIKYKYVSVHYIFVSFYINNNNSLTSLYFHYTIYHGQIVIWGDPNPVWVISQDCNAAF